MLVVDTTFTTNKQSIDKQKFKRQMCELYAIREKINFIINYSMLVFYFISGAIGKSCYYRKSIET